MQNPFLRLAIFSLHCLGAQVWNGENVSDLVAAEEVIHSKSSHYSKLTVKDLFLHGLT